MTKKGNVVRHIENLLKKSEAGEKLDGEQRRVLGSYRINSVAGAGNSEFRDSVFHHISRIKDALNIRIPECVHHKISPSKEAIRGSTVPLDQQTELSMLLRTKLEKVIQRTKVDAILLSGGIDSSLLAALDPSPLAITVGLEDRSNDLPAAQEVAEYLGMRWHPIVVTMEEMRDALKRLVILTKSYDIGLLNDIPLLLGMEHAAQYGYKRIRTGEAADVLFSGYSSGWLTQNFADLLRETIPKITLSTSRIGTLLNRYIHEPYFDQEIREFAMELPEEERTVRVRTPIPGDMHVQEFSPSFELAKTPVEENIWSKIIIRRCALGLLPIHLIFRQKQDLQYGSGAYLLEEELKKEVSNNLYESLQRTVHPFYNKAHASLYQMYKELGLPLLSEKEVQRPCNWCGSDLGEEKCHCSTCGAYEANLPPLIRQTDADTAFINEARKRLPLFAVLPDWILKQLDTDELALPDQIVEDVRKKLENRLGHYVMTYNRGVFKTELPPSAHLCNWIKGASLDPEQRGELGRREAEVAHTNVSFVAYEKPLGIVPPSSNPLRISYLEYQRRLQEKK